MVKSINWKWQNYNTATLKYALSSTKKVELIAKMIRWKNAEQAMAMLSYMPKKSAKILLKVLKSAVANMKNQKQYDEDKSYISKIDIWKWPSIKRIKFVGRARVHPYNKYRSFIRVVLDNK